jgi:hypothetical protein
MTPERTTQHPVPAVVKDATRKGWRRLQAELPSPKAD